MYMYIHVHIHVNMEKMGRKEEKVEYSVRWCVFISPFFVCFQLLSGQRLSHWRKNCPSLNVDISTHGITYDSGEMATATVSLCNHPPRKGRRERTCTYTLLFLFLSLFLFLFLSLPPSLSFFFSHTTEHRTILATVGRRPTHVQEESANARAVPGLLQSGGHQRKRSGQENKSVWAELYSPHQPHAR